MDIVRSCDMCQRHRAISWHHKLPMTPNLEVELFDVWVTSNRSNWGVTEEVSELDLIRRSTPNIPKIRACKTRVLSLERKDQVGGKNEQLAHCLEVLRSSTMSPNDPEHDDAEG
uniref:Uncharacterized protein n=1 Tax=Solanum tuberosum TaxID=4113 RepID=M1DJM9_SOLTU